MRLPHAGRWVGLLIALFVSAAGAQVSERLKSCAGCHGPDGNSVQPGIPSIAAQPRIFLENALVLTREGIRGNAVMQALLKGLSDKEIVGIAAHFSALPARPEPAVVDKTLFQRGRQVAGKLRCASCHSADFRGREQMPRLAGQREEYLHDTLRAFRDKPPPGTDTIMAATLYGVADADLKALAHYLARLR